MSPAIHRLFKKEGEQWFLTPTDSHQEFDGVDPDSTVTLRVRKTYTIHKIVRLGGQSLSYPDDATEIDCLFTLCKWIEDVQLELTVPLFELNGFN